MRILLLLLISVPAVAQQTIPLWPGTPPDQKNTDQQEEHIRNDNLLWIKNVQNPTLEVYVPAKGNATGEAVLIFPGGGYQGLAYDWEGTDVAKWCNTYGVAGVVVKYRLPVSTSLSKPRHAPLQDAQRAVRLARQMADSLGWTRIGVMGFSAGGHLASTVSTRYNLSTYQPQDAADDFSARPDFSILIYPVITAGDKAHKGSVHALVGENPSEEALNFFSSDQHVDTNTPPTILIHAVDDKGVPVDNSFAYFDALRSHEVYAELHVYPYGGHGFSFAHDKGYLAEWPDRVMTWIKNLPE